MPDPVMQFDAPELPDQGRTGFGALATSQGALPLQALDVAAIIDGLTAHVTVRQRFVNANAEPLEATYVFPLPDRAAVIGCTFQTAGRTVAAELKERGQARQEYTQAVQAGHRAALAEEDRPDTFSLRVGNLPPGAAAEVTLTLVQPLPFGEGEATFRFPLVVAPRYVPGKPLPGPDGISDASRTSPPVLLPGFLSPVRLGLTVDVRTGGLPLGPCRCSLHAVSEELTGGGRRFTLRPGERLDRDYLLRFRLDAETVRAALVVRPDPDGQGGTFQLTLVAPADGGAARPVLTGLKLEPAGLLYEPATVVPARLPDLFAGTAVVVTGRCPARAGGGVTVQATDAAGRHWTATVPAVATANPAVTALWARGHVRELEDRLDARQDDPATLEKRIVATALKFGVLCRFTRFGAADNTGDGAAPGPQPGETSQGGQPPAPAARPTGSRLSAGLSRLQTSLASKFPAAPRTYETMKRDVTAKLLDKLDLSRISAVPADVLRKEIRGFLERLADTECLLLSRQERDRLLDEVVAEVLGLGPLESLLEDVTISAIQIPGSRRNLLVERRGRWETTDRQFRDDYQLLQILDRVAAKVGRRLDESSPYLQARLPDDTLVTAVIPPLAPDGPTALFRRPPIPMRLDDLAAFGILGPGLPHFLEGALRAGLNVWVAGPPSAERAELAQALLGRIPDDAWTVILADHAQPQYQQLRATRLLAGPGRPLADLVGPARRLGARRLVVAEADGPTVPPLVRAAGDAGIALLAVGPGSTVRDFLAWLEAQAVAGGLAPTAEAARPLVARAVHLVLAVTPQPDGRAAVQEVAEVVGAEAGRLEANLLFVRRDGRLVPQGILPSFLDRIDAVGGTVPRDLFRPTNG